jgi:LSU ribosomal protein L14E
LNGKIQIGQIVKSISGRDQNRYFIIVSIVDDKNVLISDGKLRKIQNPKLKS